MHPTKINSVTSAKLYAPSVLLALSSENIGKKVAKECSYTLMGRHLELEMFCERKIVLLLFRDLDVYSVYWRVYIFIH